MMSNNKSTLSALSAAAFILNGLSAQANAESDAGYSFEYLYSKYKEDDVDSGDVASGDSERYEIDTHQVRAVVPFADESSLTVNALYETMSGASPFMVIPDGSGGEALVMSGATIEETRSQLDLSYFQKHRVSETTTTLSYSKENDYDALSFGVSGLWYFNNRLTTLNYGLNGGQDHIDPTGRSMSETKTRLSGFIGFSQVINANRLIGADFSITSLNGYLSDPYKGACISLDGTQCTGGVVSDARPDRKLSYAATVKWREFVPQYDGALHADLGLFRNDWEVTAASANVAWYQNLGYRWQLIPSLRLYRQTEAEFYEPYYTSTRADGYYSSDARLSEFTSVSGRFKVRADWKKVTFSAALERYQSFGDHPALVNFNVFSVGLSSNF